LIARGVAVFVGGFGVGFGFALPRFGGFFGFCGFDGSAAGVGFSASAACQVKYACFSWVRLSR
jgi:hypothetical protein